MFSNGAKRRYPSPALLMEQRRRTPLVQKRLFCVRLYQAWLNSLSEDDLDKMVSQLIRQGHEFRMGKE